MSTIRLPALDGVRGIAILMVMALHVGYVVHPASPGLPRSYATGGFAGVDVFFVLSAFLITTLLLEEKDRTGGVSLSDFYARRAFRLLPALGLLLAAHLLYAIDTGLSIRREAEALLSVSFYSSNFTQSFHMYMPSELSHTWSLAIEEQFYLLWPSLLILIFAFRSARRGDLLARIPWALAGALVVNDVTRILVWWNQGYPAAYMLPYCHADGLIIGCTLAFIYKRGYTPSTNAEIAGWVSFLGLVVFTFFWVQGRVGESVFYGGYTVLAAAAALLINGALLDGGSLQRCLSWRPLVMVGRVSYGLYLWHVMVLTILVQHQLGLGRWPRAALGVFLSCLATAVSWKFVEQPALRFKRRFGRRGQQISMGG